MYRLSHDRTVEYLCRDALVCIKEDEITIERLSRIAEYLRVFPELIYVEDNTGKLKGIMTRGDVRKSIDAGRIFVNMDFFFYRETDEINEGILQNFFDEHISVRGIPIMESGRLQGEYRLRLGNEDESKRLDWSSLSERLDEWKCENNGKQILGGENIREKLKQSIYDLDDGAGCVSETDVYLECLIRHMSEIFQKEDVFCMFIEAPVLKKIKEKEQWVGDVAERNLSLEQIAKDDHLLDMIYGDNESRYYLKTKEYEFVHYLDRGTYYNLGDYAGKYFHVINGMRITTDVQGNPKMRIHIFGTCIARGHCVSDAFTVESILQRKLNETAPGEWEVKNYGVAQRAGNEINDFNYALHSEFQRGDIVIFLAEYSDKVLSWLQKYKVTCLETSELFSGKADLGRWFLDQPIHVNHKANQMIADFIYKKITQKTGRKNVGGERFVLYKENDPFERNRIPEELEGYLREVERMISEKERQLCSKEKDAYGGVLRTIGACVMNCNPFSLGHRHLIEMASRNAGILVVFVVKEDKSEVPFDDRIRLVREGTSDLSNVIVVSSGNFILSTKTFPEYFHKSQLQEIPVDASADVRIFGKYVSKRLGITKRFVGEEPIDKVTASYNRVMCDLLPKYGVDVIEIPRKKVQPEGEPEQVISASVIRRLWREGEYEKLKSYVPETTLRYLCNPSKREGSL